MGKARWRGSATVEAAIIMPIFLLMLVTMLMFAMFVYEKAAMRSVCNRVTAEGASMWQRGAEYISTYYANGGVLPQEVQEKVHIFDIYADYFKNLVDTEKNAKIVLLEDHLKKEIARHSFILTEGDVDVKVDLSSVLIHKRLVSMASADYHLPLYEDRSEVSAECVISAQTELIRTIDFAADMLDGPMAGVKESYQKMIGKLQELLDKVRFS